jgi:hypothetical protein
MLEAMRRLALVAAATLTVAACTDGEGSTPAPRNAPPVTSPGPSVSPGPAAQQPTTAVPPHSGDTKYTALATPCAELNGQSGAKLPSSQDTAARAIAQCAYAEQPGQVKVSSSATIAKGSGSDQATKTLYQAAVSKASTRKVDGVATEPREGLGDEAVLVTRFDDHTTALYVRSGNALIQTSATVRPQMDRESELLQLQRQETVLTELAKSMLAQLR